MLIQTSLKNGYSFTADCDDLIIKKSNLTGDIVGATWAKCKTGKPIYVDMNEIVSIVRLDDITKEDA